MLLVMTSPENAVMYINVKIVLQPQATQFAHTIAEVRRLKGSIADATVSHVTVGLSQDCCPTQNAVHTAFLSASSPL